jgi:excisionase family DNA binding protein
MPSRSELALRFGLLSWTERSDQFGGRFPGRRSHRSTHLSPSGCGQHLPAMEPGHEGAVMTDADLNVDSDDLASLRSLTVEEVAVLLGMSKAWVRKGVLERSLPFTKLGRSVRFTPDQVRQILRDGERLPARADPARSARRGTARTRL